MCKHALTYTLRYAVRWTLPSSKTTPSSRKSARCVCVCVCSGCTSYLHSDTRSQEQGYTYRDFVDSSKIPNLHEKLDNFKVLQHHQWRQHHHTHTPARTHTLAHTHRWSTFTTTTRSATSSRVHAYTQGGRLSVYGIQSGERERKKERSRERDRERDSERERGRERGRE